MLLTVDMARLQERWRGAVHTDVVLGGQVLHALQFIHSGVEPAAFNLRIAADVADAITSEVLEVHIVGRRGLVAQFEQARCLRIWSRSRLRASFCRHSCARGSQPRSAGVSTK